ncbi:heme/hemin ABC transporter substrate-binding protein [Paracoccus saliphilus]|uniref:ABC transporter substrate-binding protein n=1 Tax=Paracoccus saliphilus TaxID=405559 RepID=A0AA45W5H6_9RHOB|nr:ABC transporter substrate-binding protein [Paracoccus saliphilus]WCR02332.1 ABC transporter substrate-binding protein [Paracoccus saliphilus]SIS93712.1 iron complex transport system substrate-binding protein [Paracoccus saliphilus]
MIARAVCAATLALSLTMPAQADPHPDAERVLAIGGSVTEIIYALGQQGRLIARDTTSSFPAEAQELPDVGYMRALSSEGVLSVKPDLILSEEGAGPPETVAILKEAGIPFETIPSGTDAEGLTAKIEAVAEVLGVPEAADAPVEALRADLDSLAEATGNEGQPKRVMFILSLQGGRVMASGQGTEADAIIRLAGAENAVQGVEGYKPLTDEAITSAAPEVILMMKRGPEDSGHAVAAEALMTNPAIAATPAIESGSVIRMDGLYLLGFGPRTGQAALDLHDAIYGGT